MNTLKPELWNVEKSSENKFLLEILEKLEKNEELTDNYSSIISKIEEIWKTKKRSLKETIDLYQTIEFVFRLEPHVVEEVFKKCMIFVTPKDRKKGRVAYVKRLLDKYYKESVQNFFHQMFKSMTEEENLLSNHDDEALNDSVNNQGYYTTWWICEAVLNKKEALSFLKNSYPEKYLDMISRLLLFYEAIHLEEVLDFEQKQKNQNKKTIRIQSEYKTLTIKLGKLNKETQELKHSLYKTKKEKKKIKQEYYHLLKEHEELSNQTNILIQELHSSFEKQQNYYLETIQRLTNQLKETHSEFRPSSDLHLNGKTISVIGGVKERHYRDIVQKYGGKISFVSVSDPKKIKGSISESDAVFFLTELVKHQHFYVAFNEAKEKNIPFVFINSKGITTFEKELLLFFAS